MIKSHETHLRENGHIWGVMYLTWVIDGPLVLWRGSGLIWGEENILEWFNSFMAYLRARAFICCELNMTWTIWESKSPFDTTRVFFSQNRPYLSGLEWNHKAWRQEDWFGVRNDITWY